MLLAAKSPVFNAMFCGELAEQEQINLLDCEHEGMLEFLRFLYTEAVHLSGMNGIQVLYLAEKYTVPNLTKRCNSFLNLNFKCVFRVKARRFLFK